MYINFFKNIRSLLYNDKLRKNLIYLSMIIWLWNIAQITQIILEDVEHYGHTSLDLDFGLLAFYASQTTIRLFIALLISSILSVVVGKLMIKYKRFSSFIEPCIDILQSIPIVGFLALTTQLFPSSTLGYQMAIISGILTTQIWNMILSVYQSLKDIPSHLQEISYLYNLSSIDKFFKIELPHILPGLIWNAMLSISSSWFMIVLSERLVLQEEGCLKTVNMPGIGSFIYEATLQQNNLAIVYASCSILLIIILYDSLLFKPILHMACQSLEGKRFNKGPLTDFYQGAFYYLSEGCSSDLGLVVKSSLDKIYNLCAERWDMFQKLLLLSLAFYFYNTLQNFFLPEININFYEIMHLLNLGLITFVRVVVVLFLATIIWLPIGIWVGLRPKVVSIVQPLIQVIASFPLNIFYGLFAEALLYFNLDFNIWCTLLMLLGTQWNTLFNVIAGASLISDKIKINVKQMRLTYYSKWTKVYIPCVIHDYMTGIIATSGAAWNASIICEHITWGSNSDVVAKGLGSFLSLSYESSPQELYTGIVIMSLLIGIINRFFWHNVLMYVNTRFKKQL